MTRVRAALARRLNGARAAAWALRAVVSARRQLRRGPITAIVLPDIPRVPRAAGAGVAATLRRARWSCLERSLVRQHWLAAHGIARDLVIGIKPGRSLDAHAWLEGDPASAWEGYEELSRHPASDAGHPAGRKG